MKKRGIVAILTICQYCPLFNTRTNAIYVRNLNTSKPNNQMKTTQPIGKLKRLRDNELQDKWELVHVYAMTSG